MVSRDADEIAPRRETVVWRTPNMTTAADYQQLQAMRELPAARLVHRHARPLVGRGGRHRLAAAQHGRLRSRTRVQGRELRHGGDVLPAAEPVAQCAPNATGTATQNPCAARRRDGPAGRRTASRATSARWRACNRTASADDVTLERNQANFSPPRSSRRSVAPLARGVWAYATLASRLLRRTRRCRRRPSARGAPPALGRGPAVPWAADAHGRQED